jgi:hypothetical protein
MTRGSAVRTPSLLTLSVEATPGRPGSGPVSVLVDGRPAFAAVAPQWQGFDAAELLGPDSPLLPVHPWRRVAVYRCSCGIADCGVIAPLIAQYGPDLVRWADFRDYDGVFDGPVLDEDPQDGEPWNLPDLWFDRDQYLAEVHRAIRLLG